MTDSTRAAARASFAEDFIDIFYAPSAVFARRGEASPWPVMLIVMGLFIVATYIWFSLLSPVVDAEMSRQMAEAVRQNPSLPAEQMAAGQRFARIMMMVAAVLLVPVTTLVLGLLLWIVGKLFDAQQPLRAAFLVVAFSWMPRVLESLLGSLQAFVLDPNSLPSLAAASLSPARFVDADTASPALIALLSRFSPFIVWSYVIIAVGLAITGRISGRKAAIAAAVLWLLGSLAAVVPAMAR